MTPTPTAAAAAPSAPRARFDGAVRTGGEERKQPFQLGAAAFRALLIRVANSGRRADQEFEDLAALMTTVFLDGHFGSGRLKSRLQRREVRLRGLGTAQPVKARSRFVASAGRHQGLASRKSDRQEERLSGGLGAELPFGKIRRERKRTRKRESAKTRRRKGRFGQELRPSWFFFAFSGSAHKCWDRFLGGRQPVACGRIIPSFGSHSRSQEESHVPFLCPDLSRGR
jgi:hypothetical protein